MGPARTKKRRAAPTGRLARHRVLDKIRERILSGKYPPGAQLRQMQLAKEFGVAQGVVRESLLELKACGLVRVVDNLGVFVCELDAKKLIEAYEIREVLEGMAARLCCQRASRQDLAELEKTAKEMYRLARQGKREEMGALDREFHLRMIQISRNEMLEQLTESYRVLGKVLRVDRNPREVRDDHLAILRAVERNRPDDAERLMRAHIRAARTMIEQRVADGTFVPQWV
jgi:DNA-binding GntR family transcriptional regulator